MSLVTKYAPRCFEDIRGQARAVGILSEFVLRDVPHHILLQGAYGAGKTTLAKIYAKALNCKNAEPVFGSPCNRADCATCSDESLYLHEIDVPLEAADSGSLAPLIQARHVVPASGIRPIVFLDEAHALKREDSDELLKTLEGEHPNATYIFATTEPWLVRETVRSRLQPVEVHALSLSSSINFLIEIIEAEGLKAELSALSLIAAVAKGHPRNLLNRLDSVIDRRSPEGTVLTEADVRSRLCIDSDAFLLKYFNALAGESPDEATVILHNWSVDWDAKSRWVQSILLVLYYDLLKLDAFVDPVVDGISIVDRRALLTAFRQRWNISDPVAMRASWSSIMSVWIMADPAPTDAAIRLRFAEFEARVAMPLQRQEAVGLSPTPPLNDTGVPEPKERRDDTAWPDVIVSSNRYLELAHVIDIADRSSFFVQETGRGFNFELTYHPHEDETGRASAKIDVFIKDLLAFDGVHSTVAPRGVISVLERNKGGVYARVIGRLHGPGYVTSFSAELQAWFANKLYRVETETMSIDESRKQSLGFHWRAVAHLCGALSKERWPSTPLKKRLGVGRPRDPGPIPPPHALVRFYESVTGDALRKATELRMPFLSAILDNAWDFVAENWEINEAAYRKKLKETRRQEFRDLTPITYNSDFADPAKALAYLESQWSDPRSQPRPWPTWWSSNA